MVTSSRVFWAQSKVRRKCGSGRREEKGVWGGVGRRGEGGEEVERRVGSGEGVGRRVGRGGEERRGGEGRGDVDRRGKGRKGRGVRVKAVGLKEST